MNGYRIGVFAGLAVAVALVLARPTIHSQTQTSGSSAVHSVKITLAAGADKESCELRGIVPEESGVYIDDRLVWHIENGCAVPVRVAIRTISPAGPQGGPQSGAFEGVEKLMTETVEPRKRGEISTRVLVRPPEGAEYVYDYTVVVGPPRGVPDRPGKIKICREPPCGPPLMKPPVKK